MLDTSLDVEMDEMGRFIESMSSLGEESQSEDSSETTTSSSTSSDDSEEAMCPSSKF